MKTFKILFQFGGVSDMKETLKTKVNAMMALTPLLQEKQSVLLLERVDLASMGDVACHMDKTFFCLRDGVFTCVMNSVINWLEKHHNDSLPFMQKAFSKQHPQEIGEPDEQYLKNAFTKTSLMVYPKDEGEKALCCVVVVDVDDAHWPKSEIEAMSFLLAVHGIGNQAEDMCWRYVQNLK